MPGKAAPTRYMSVPQVLWVRVVVGEVGCKYGGCELVAVGTGADEAADEAGAEGWLECWSWCWRRAERRRLRCQNLRMQVVYGTTEACGGRFIFVRPAVIGQASQREVGLGFVDGSSGGVCGGCHCWIALQIVLVQALM